MGLKVIVDGAFGSGKTALAATLAEVGPVGVCDSEQRWQYYTVPHPHIQPRTAMPPEIMVALNPAGDGKLAKAWTAVYVEAYAAPRMLRQDVAWLPKTENVVWLVQTMDPINAWNVTRIWANDAGIKGLVKDSASVYWDILQDAVDRSSNLGGLAWTPVKRTDRRSTYTLLKSGKHWILTAHTQEKMNAKMEVVARVPWVEKKNPHWADLVLRMHFQENEKVPRCEVVKEKILGGKGGALRKGVIVSGLTFGKLLSMAGTIAEPAKSGETMEKVERRVESAVARISKSAYQPGVDNEPKEVGK